MLKFAKLILVALLLFTTCKKGSKGPIEVIPLAPSNLSASLTSSTQVNLSWTDNSTNETGFKIERKTSGGVYQIISTTGADINSFTDNLPTNSSYSYRVYSYNSAGNSLAYSNEQSINNNLPMLITTGVSQITGISGSSGGEIASSGSDIIARGVVWSISPNPTVSLSTKTVDGIGVTAFTSKLTGLKLNTTYYLRAYATNLAGTSYGNEITFTTLNVDLETGLVAYFPFNGNATDESGNGNNGVILGAQPTTDRFNNPNKAYSFNDNSIQVANSATLNPPNITISLWLLHTGTNRCILAKNNPYDARSASYMLTIDDNAGSSQMGFSVGYGIGYCTSQYKYFGYGPRGQIPQNSWNHVAVTIKANGEVNCYLNGDFWFNLVGDPYSPCNDSSSILKIGGPYWNSNKQSFLGKLDEIRFYNRILTSEEIKFLSKN